MVEELLFDKKLIPIPKPLSDQLRLVTVKLGTNISSYTTEALEQALRAGQLGSDLKEVVNLYQMTQIQRGAGMIFIQRAGFKELVTKLFKKDREALLELWYNSGKWYSAYLSARLNQDILNFLEKDLLVSWNLDESEILTKDVMASIRLTSFGMSSELTELLVMYTKGIFKELEYDASDEDVLPGLISIKFLKKMKKN